MSYEMLPTERKSIVREKSFDFALRIVHMYQHLQTQKKEFVLSKQLLRSGTSIGANVREAQNAESIPDFIHKMGIAQKETDETLYWLALLKASGYLTDVKAESLIVNADELPKILRSIIITSKQNRDKKSAHNS